MLQLGHEMMVQAAINETAQAFHLRAETELGVSLAVPCTYQIEEPGFRPFRAGKGTPEELQSALDQEITAADRRNIDIGIEGHDSVRKLALQMGLGIDCSNFAYHCMTRIYEGLQLPAYASTVYLAGEDVRDNHQTRVSWRRELDDEASEQLARADWLPVDWVAATFAKDPQFITGSWHMTAPEAATPVAYEEVRPGDLLAFRKVGGEAVSHVAVVESVEEAAAESRHVQFWHSWHTRDFDSGLRRDGVVTNGRMHSWSHQGLADPDRYAGHFFCRPQALKLLGGSATLSA